MPVPEATRATIVADPSAPEPRLANNLLTVIPRFDYSNIREPTTLSYRLCGVYDDVGRVEGESKGHLKGRGASVL
jgi:hypothetical protein